MDSVLRMGRNKVVGFAILVEIDGEKMLIYSDTVIQGQVTLHNEMVALESDDGVSGVNSRSTHYEVSLLGENITLRREQRPMEELLLEDSQYQHEAIGRLLDAERDPD